MTMSTIWWLLAGAVVAIELVTGTFYLLMIGIGLAAAALATYFGANLTGQLITAALVGGGAVVLWHQRARRRPASAPVNANADVHLDIGAKVHVTHWNSDGTATVQYRGASWTAVLSGHPGTSLQTPSPGEFVIREMIGNRLVLRSGAD